MIDLALVTEGIHIYMDSYTQEIHQCTYIYIYAYIIFVVKKVIGLYL